MIYEIVIDKMGDTVVEVVEREPSDNCSIVESLARNLGTPIDIQITGPDCSEEEVSVVGG